MPVLDTEEDVGVAPNLQGEESLASMPSMLELHGDVSSPCAPTLKP